MSSTTQLVGDGQALRVQRPKVSLEVVSGPDTGRTLTSGDAEITVGTAEGNSLVLSDATVSKHHFRIQVTSNGYWLTDLQSTNGTRMGNSRVLEAVLQGSTTLVVGGTTLEFRITKAQTEVSVPNVDRFGDLIGRSAPMLELFGQLLQVAERNVTILLRGETGTGKELIAREIHRHSLRKKEPYIIVDCGAIPEGLIVSELFGHTKGAFTGAERDRRGAFEAADGGTIFLDEIGELDLNLQTMLLRVLETGEIKRAGESKHRKVNVRVIAATHRDLRQLINKEKFRTDLYYRLAVVSMNVPPLRERADDIKAIAEHLLPQIAEKMDAPPAPALTDSQYRQLSRHDWPGNVRELRNILERYVAFGGTRELFAADDAFAVKAAPVELAEALIQAKFKDAKAAWVERFESAYLEALLERNGHNVAEVARKSGLARSHIFRLLKKHGIERATEE